MQVEHFLERSAARYGGKTALVCGRHRLTYAEIEQRANRLAHSFLAAGIERWDRVAVYLDNSVEAAIAIFAILKAGGVFLTINPTTKADKLAYILNNCRARGLVLPSAKLGMLASFPSSTPHLECVWFAGSGGAPQPEPAPPAFALDEVFADPALPVEPPPKKNIDIDLAALIYTSGSTGRPKGVMLTHRNIVSAATSITTYLENVPDDIIINVLPLSFDYGLYQLLMAFQVGGTLVLEPSFTYPHAVLRTMIREQVTGFPLVPTIAAILLQLDLSSYSFPALRYITNTAAALPAEHIRRLRALFPGVKLYSMYGLTECKRVSYLPPEQLDIRPTSVGRGMPNEEVYLVDEHGRRVPPGGTGELVVRGSNVMKGYWELPEETARMLRPGLWPGETVLYTGDVFRTDDEGYLYFVGRKDDIIKSRGEKVSPREVEEVLCEIPGVAEAAVAGVPDPVLGQAIHAFLVLSGGTELSAQDVLKHCAQRLENFMVPHAVFFVTSLPKTASGKVSRRELAVAPSGADR